MIKTCICLNKVASLLAYPRFKRSYIDSERARTSWSFQPQMEEKRMNRCCLLVKEGLGPSREEVKKMIFYLRTRQGHMERNRAPLITLRCLSFLIHVEDKMVLSNFVFSLVQYIHIYMYVTTTFISCHLASATKIYSTKPQRKTNQTLPPHTHNTHNYMHTNTHKINSKSIP